MAIITECEAQECQVAHVKPGKPNIQRHRTLGQERTDVEGLTKYYRHRAYEEAVSDLERNKTRAISMGLR